MATPFQSALLFMVKVYRYAVSPLLPPSCIYTPTCSAYCMEAVQTYGAFKGSWMTLKRLLRCHPFHSGGYDPVDRAGMSDHACTSNAISTHISKSTGK